MRRNNCAALFLCIWFVSSLDAANVALSIGIRETQAGGGASGGPIFSDGGSAGGIEFVNRDGQTLAVDGTWKLFTFTPKTDTLTAFAGTTANAILEGNWGVLEHLRVRNIDGITLPIRLWVDNVANTNSTGSVIEGFEGYAPGVEVILQEPRFSGSTASNLTLTPNMSAVSDTIAFAGSQSYEMNFQFIDSDPTRWVRLTSFNTPNVPNPAIQLQENAFTPTISFYARAILIPEPNSMVLAGLVSLFLLVGIKWYGKQFHPAHASIQDVERYPSRSDSCGTRHPQRLPRSRSLVNKRACPPYSPLFPSPYSP